MEIVLVVFKVFYHFDGGHIFLECEVGFVVYAVCVGFFEEVEE